MRHLLVNCDLGWVTDSAKFRTTLEHRFDRVTILPLAEDPLAHDLSTVTHWITNPAPRFKITESFVRSNMPQLTCIGSPSTGTTHIDLALLNGGLTVKCLRDVRRDQLARITSSSEHTFFLFLALVRKAKTLLAADLSQWRDDLPRFRGRQVMGMKVMVFGHGRIGSNLTRYLQAFGAEVLVHEPDSARHLPGPTFISMEEVLALLPTVDAAFLCFHWSPQNDGFFHSNYLNAMRDDAFLVNTSRGENLDEAHLATLISKGKFAGVALDVLRGEQLSSFHASPLLKLVEVTERLIITPHIAGASYDSERLAFEFTLNLIAP